MYAPGLEGCGANNGQASIWLSSPLIVNCAKYEKNYQSFGFHGSVF